jgi:hypothetical protein
MNTSVKSAIETAKNYFEKVDAGRLPDELLPQELSSFLKFHRSDFRAGMSEDVSAKNCSIEA